MRASLLNLVFGQTAGADPIKIGPLHEFRIEGETVRERPGGPVIARHSGHAWQVGATPFFCLDCPGPLQLRFEDAGGQATRSFGPFHAA